MMIDALRRRAGALVLPLILLASGLSAAQDSRAPATPPGTGVSYSEAERTLWMTNQLHMVKSPLRVTYAFEKSGTYEQGFTDSIQLDLHTVNADGTKNASVTFFTGERNHFVPESERIEVNPVLGLYMQGDTYEMGRLTGKHERWRYFHRRLKYAFAESAQVTDIEVDFAGKKVPARQVYFQPYIDDPRRTEMLQFAAKEYWITVSDSVPGYLYEIRTRVAVKPADGQPAAPPLLEERLRLSEAKPLPLARAER